MIELQVVGGDLPALVDDNFPHLIGYRWRLDREGYVFRKAKGRRIYLHHTVLPSIAGSDLVRDHINREKLDNRCGNLRWLSRSQSPQNRNVCRCNLTGVRGVRFDAKRQQYLARVQHKGKAVAREWFPTIEAASSYLAAVRPALLPASHG